MQVPAIHTYASFELFLKCHDLKFCRPLSKTTTTTTTKKRKIFPDGAEEGRAQEIQHGHSSMLHLELVCHAKLQNTICPANKAEGVHACLQVSNLLCRTLRTHFRHNHNSTTHMRYTNVCPSMQNMPFPRDLLSSNSQFFFSPPILTLPKKAFFSSPTYESLTLVIKYEPNRKHDLVC